MLLRFLLGLVGRQDFARFVALYDPLGEFTLGVAMALYVADIFV
jgi:hypothetical protein